MDMRTWFTIKKFTDPLDAIVTIEADGRRVTLVPGDPALHPGKKPTSVLRCVLYGIKCGIEITVTAEGPDAQKALDVVLTAVKPNGYIRVYLTEEARKRRAGFQPTPAHQTRQVGRSRPCRGR